MNEQTNQLIHAITVMMVMSMGMGVMQPMVLQLREEPHPGAARAKALTWGLHKEVLHSLEEITTQVMVLRGKLPRYIELVEPYIEASELVRLKKLLEPFPSTEDLIGGLEIVRKIDWEGLQERR